MSFYFFKSASNRKAASSEEYEINDEVSGKSFFGEDLEIKDPILRIAEKKFGVKYLFPWQHLVISNILDASNDLKNQAIEKLNEEYKGEKDLTDAFCMGRQIVLLPTGAGKSMCFLLPSLLLDGPTLIFYPLLALMSDQERRMKEGGIDCVTFRGGQTEHEREENFRRLRNGARIILANPEVLQNEKLVERLKNTGIAHIAIDEAHCVSEWGDTFRPAYLTLGSIIKKLEVPLVTAFTATASPSVLDRISEILFDRNAHLVRGESDRTNLHYSVHYAFSKKKAALKLAMTEKKPLLIFCGTRNKAQDMALELSECMGDKVKFYHAGLTREEKDRIEKWFFPRDDAVLCVTCAFGMGVDKSNIRTVIHLEPSPTAESYIQEAGRGGRDKKPSKAILIWSPEDSEKYSSFLKGSRERVLKEFAEAESCRRQVLLDALGGEKAVCSGCDVCEARKALHYPSLSDSEDAKLVHEIIWKNRKHFSEAEAVQKSKEILNRKDRSIFGINVWDAEAVKEIVDGLKKEGIVYSSGLLWKGNLNTVKKFDYPNKSSIQNPGRHPLPRLHFLRQERELEQELLS